MDQKTRGQIACDNNTLKMIFLLYKFSG